MNLTDAVIDLRYLLDRGYPHKSALRFVCNHYRIDEGARRLLSRTVLPRAVSERRRKKFLPCEEIQGNDLLIDGYNIIIGMESILENKAYLCDDSVIRDIKGVFRSYQTSGNTEKAIDIILQFLQEMSPGSVCFLMDAQMSMSGLLAQNLRTKISEIGLNGEARTSRQADHDLKCSTSLIASSDGVIIDEAISVVNFLYCIVSRFRYLEAGVIRKESDMSALRVTA